MMPPADWPNRDSSRRVRAGVMDWHVQEMGDGPDVLLLHGTGAATHSWRDLAPLLARRFRVLAPDLPGHAFTEFPARARMSIDGMATALRDLLRTLGRDPALIVGHSAGAAIGIHMALEGLAHPRGIVGLGAALLPMGGTAGQLFSPLAKLLAGLPFLPALFSSRARDPATVKRLLDGTGSRLDERGTALYGQLFQNRLHAGAALEMMARWDLATLARAMPRLQTPLLLVAGGRDRTIPAGQSAEVMKIVPAGERIVLEGLGHLLHEERPAEVAQLIEAFAARLGT